MDAELLLLIQRSQKVSNLSAGHFDISFGSIQKVWNFTTFDQDAVPSQEALAQSVALINYQDIVVDAVAGTVQLAQEGMRIGFGAIGKGYAANQARDLMQSLGASSGVVNAGGDLIAWGQKPEGGPWLVGIADPKDDHHVLGWIDATNMAVVTSGNYKKFITIDGKRYCHIVNPHTGWPVENLTSVTIACPDAELADALATTVFVLGKTAEFTLPVKIGHAVRVFPFARFHSQTGADYFAEFQQHDASAAFYTSDFDLSSFTSYKVGAGISWSPLFGFSRFAMGSKTATFKTISVRVAHYNRSDGLTANMLTAGVTFKIKQ